MHLFTTVQLVCLINLWGVKESPAALALALLILILVPFRFWILKYWFNPVEMDAVSSDIIIREKLHSYSGKWIFRY